MVAPVYPEDAKRTQLEAFGSVRSTYRSAAGMLRLYSASVPSPEAGWVSCSMGMPSTLAIFRRVHGLGAWRPASIAHSDVGVKPTALANSA
jgi:hypothetical protein